MMFVSGCASSDKNILSKRWFRAEQTFSSEDQVQNKTETDDNIQLIAAEETETSESSTKFESTESHSVDDYVQMALANNPKILAAQHRVAAQTEVIPQVTSLDDPTLTNTFQPFHSHSVQTAAGRSPNTLALSQKFPWFGKLHVRGEVAEAETQVALTQLAQVQLKVIEDVHLAYYDLYFNQKAIKITKEDKRLLAELLKFAEARYRTGKVSQQDVLLAEVELDKLDNRLILLRQKLKQAQADLAEVIQADPQSDLKALSLDVPSAPVQINQLYEAAIFSRPEIQEQLHAIIRNQKAEELARLQYKPDLKLGIGWQAITNDDAISSVANSNDNLAFTVGVNLPIYREKLRAAVSEAEHRSAETTRNYEATRNDTFRKIRRLTVKAISQEEQIKLFRDKIIPKTEQALRISATDYRVGKVDFQQIVDNWSDLLALQIQLVRLESHLGQTLASLERVVGRELTTFSNPAELPPSPMPAKHQNIK